MDNRLSLAAPTATKAKAFEDARKAQASILKECADAGKEPPPYILSELIGKGSFGRVYKATKPTKPGLLVAVKIISIEDGDAAEPGTVDTLGDILKEVNTLKLLSASGARNINTVLDTLLVGQSVWMITEYCAGGSVSTLMRPTGFLPEKWIIPILREVAEAIYWVHRQGIIHRDIKCANVLVTEAGQIQLCDFGVAGIIETKFDKRRTVTGTLHWMAPELFTSNVSYGTEVDIWAFGSMAYEVASGLPPNAAMAIDISDFGSYLKQHCPRLEGDQYSPRLKELVAFCMADDPALRPTIAQVRDHPYILNTSDEYPTTSLTTLLSAYKLWQSRGGGRLSLFSAGGAQIPVHDQALHVPAWDFSDSEEWFPLDDSADTQAVYEAYGLSFDAPTPPPIASRRRRRLPPSIKGLEAPLEKVFNPNTLSNYEDNSLQFYGGPNVAHIADLPLRDSSRHPVRESLIDLDACLIDGDQDTIRARPRSSNATDLTHRRTQDWTFPTPGPASARFDMQHPETTPDWNRQTQDWTFPKPELASTTLVPSHLEPSDQGHSMIDSRMSTTSLIDLDASIVNDLGLRPSTSHSEGTLGGSETEDTPFHLDFMRSVGKTLAQMPSISRPNREPSLYVSDDTGMYSSLDDSEDGDEYVPTATQDVIPETRPGIPLSLPALPPVPPPPSQRVMEGVASRDEVKDELLRMMSSLSEHLQVMRQSVDRLPRRRAEPSRREGPHS